MKRLLAVFLALLMGLLPVSSLAVELPELSGDCILNKEELEELFDPEQYTVFWEELENMWEEQNGSWDDLEISWEDIKTLLGDLNISWGDGENDGEGPDISLDDILGLWDLYEDLDPTRWYWNAVEFCLESGLMQGLELGLFGPNETTTRAQLVTILWRLDGSPYQTGCAELPFEDVKTNAWYAQAVCWAYENGIAAGHSETVFAPNDPINREQLVTMLYRYAEKNGFDTTGNLLSDFLMQFTYKDFNELSDWAVKPMKWAVGAGIINGTDLTHLSPKQSATRAQIATVFYNFCNVSVDDIE